MNIKESSHYQYLREGIKQIRAVSTHDHIRPEYLSIEMKPDLFDIAFKYLTVLGG